MGNVGQGPWCRLRPRRTEAGRSTAFSALLRTPQPGNRTSWRRGNWKENSPEGPSLACDKRGSQRRGSFHSGGMSGGWHQAPLFPKASTLEGEKVCCHGSIEAKGSRVNYVLIFTPAWLRQRRLRRWPGR